MLAIDWELQKRRPYVILDPMDPASLLYLSERDYQVLLRTALRNGDKLDVLARPGSVAPLDNETLK